MFGRQDILKNLLVNDQIWLEGYRGGDEVRLVSKGPRDGCRFPGNNYNRLLEQSDPSGSAAAANQACVTVSQAVKRDTPTHSETSRIWQ